MKYVIKSVKNSDLVQTTITVYDHGKSYTRKQWVKRPKGSHLTSTTHNKGTRSRPSVSTVSHRTNYNKFHRGYTHSQSKQPKSTNKTTKLKSHYIRIPNSSKFNYPTFVSLKSNRNKALLYLSHYNIKWEAHANPGVNWMRACIQANKHKNRG